MSENLHDIDDLFREPIEAHEEMPSARVWEEIDHGLDKKNTALTKRKYNKLKLFSAALLLLLISVIVFQFVATNKGGVPADKPADKLNAETVQTAPEDESHKTKLTEKSVPAQEKVLDNTAQPSIEQHPDAAMRPNPAVENREQQPDEHTVSTVTIPEAGNAKNHTISPNTKEAAAKATTGTVSNKAALNNNVVAAGENKEGMERVSSRADNPTALPNEVGKKINNSTSAITTVHIVKLNKQSGGKAAEQNEAVITVKKGNIRVFVKNRYKQLTIQQQAANNNKTGEVPATGNNTAAELDRHIVTGNKTIETPVRLIRPLEGVLIEKNSNYETADLSINVSMDDDDAMPGWVHEKAAVMPVISKKTAAVHFSVMPFFSPQFSFNRIETDEDHRRQFPQGPNYREKIRNDETYTSSSSWGILVALPLGKKWGLQSGFSYNTRSVDIQPKKIFAQLANDGKVKYRFDCSSGYTFISPKAGTTAVVGDSIIVASSSNNLQYIGVPLTLTYTLPGTNKFNIIPELGLMANFLVKQSLQTSLDAGVAQPQRITSIQGLRTTYFNGMAGLGLQYNFSKRISLNLVPAVNFAFNSINQHAAVKSYLNSFSVTGGVKLQF